MREPGACEETPMSRYEAVILDFDGVLVDSEAIKVEAFRQLYSPYGADIAEKAVAYHRKNFGISRFIKFKHIHENFLNLPYDESVGKSFGERFSSMVETSVIEAEWVPGAKEFVESFYNTIPLFIASGTPHEELLRILHRRGIRKYFKEARGSPKTKSQIIGDYVGRYGFSKEKVLMVGDSLADYAGAKEAGVGFLFVSQTEEGPQPRIPDLKLLPSIVKY